jgi:hypothetical protein
MHFEVLVEDLSGKTALDILIPKIVGDQHTFKVISYRGIGRVPKNLTSHTDASKRQLLDQLPRLLRGYGKTFSQYPSEYPAAVILVCDLDDKCLRTFRQELFAVLNGCRPRPETRFCIAIEEVEAWLLGDIRAIKAAYPGAVINLLNRYENDSICGTWERLADMLYKGGSSELKNKGWQAVGKEKSSWSKNIAPLMDVDSNASPSFRYFQGKLRELT